MAKRKATTVQTSAMTAVFSPAAASLVGDLRAAKQELSGRYLGVGGATRGAIGFRAMAAISPVANENVVGVGIGEKVVDGKPAGTHAVKIFVKLKYPEDQLDSKTILPKSISGLPVDVEQTGEFRRFARKAAMPKTKAPRPAAPRASAAGVATTMPNPRTRIRPAQPGCSVGFQDPGGQFVMAGTFGALVTSGGEVFVLSNNHVLADEGQLPLGSPIFQPGLLDGGIVATDQIAELTKFEPLVARAMNKVDCAIARAPRSALVSRDILFIGPPSGTAQAQIDMIVHKFGRTTSYTVGRVTSIDTDVTVGYETGSFTFQEQMIIQGLNATSFSNSGDSGSLILERSSQNAVGLLFAGSTTHTIANHIADVLTALGVTLA
jgi:hypothetical protein